MRGTPIRNRRPTHPGEMLELEYLRPQGISVEDFADQIGEDREDLEQVIQGNRGLSLSMVVKFAKAFNMSPAFWLNLQHSHDLWWITHSPEAKEIRGG